MKSMINIYENKTLGSSPEETFDYVSKTEFTRTAEESNFVNSNGLLHEVLKYAHHVVEELRLESAPALLLKCFVAAAAIYLAIRAASVAKELFEEFARLKMSRLPFDAQEALKRAYEMMSDPLLLLGFRAYFIFTFAMGMCTGYGHGIYARLRTEYLFLADFVHLMRLNVRVLVYTGILYVFVYVLSTFYQNSAVPAPPLVGIEPNPGPGGKTRMEILLEQTSLNRDDFATMKNFKDAMKKESLGKKKKTKKKY